MNKTEEEIEKIQEDILAKCKEKVEKENKIFYDEKLKNYEKFKSTSLENKSSILKLKKILLLRTHSKKTKRRGRKRKNNNISYNEFMGTLSKNKNKSKKKQISKKTKNNNDKNLKVYLTPKIKKLKNSIKEQDIENNKEKIISLREEDEENLEQKDDYSLMNGSITDNSYLNKIKGTPTFQMNKYEDIQNKSNNINENEQKDKINKENKIFFSVFKNEDNIFNNSNSNLNSHQRTNWESIDIKNNSNNTKNINKLIFNNNFQPINCVINNKIKNMNLNMNINLNLNNNQSSSEQKSNNSGSSSGLKDIRLTTPIKLSQTSSIVGGAYKAFHKNEGVFNYIGTDNALEKSAFNKQVIIDTPFPYSKIKTHLCFTSSIKKPVKIISYENNNQDQRSGGSGKKTNNNNYFQNIENMTPNKVIELSGSSSSDGIRFKNIEYSTSKKPECLNLNSSGRILNNPFNDFTPNKNLSPFKISNTNLDKMFFSNINSKKKS